VAKLSSTHHDPESGIEQTQYPFNELYAAGVDYDDVVATLERGFMSDRHALARIGLPGVAGRTLVG
jgi:hypothetical protein